VSARPLRHAGILWRLAVRNVARDARRSALTASAMVFGLALLMISRAIADGAHESWILAGVRLGTGHVAIQAPGFQASGALADRLDSADVARAAAALAAPDIAALVRQVAPRLTVDGLASSASAGVPVQITAGDPAVEPAFVGSEAKLVAGRPLRPGDGLTAVIGTGLATRLGLGVGGRLVLTAQASGGDIEGQLAHVVGVFRTGIPEIDEGSVHLPLATARRWLGVPGAVTTLAVLLHSSRATDRVVRALRRALADDARIRVLSWEQASPELESAVRVDDFGDYVFHGTLFAIVALAILNAVLMSVLSRSRELGLLQALGLTGRQTGLVIFAEGLTLTALSGLAGMALGFGVTWLFWRHGLDLSWLMSQDLTVSGVVVSPVIVPEFRAMQAVQSVASIAVIGVVASLYPARQATRIDVAEAMKFDR
jgi:putative ABC transport system permease protein